MTAKQFFKSTGFLSVVVLLCIALVSSFLLTLLHFLWPAVEITMDMNIVSEMYDNKDATFTEIEVVEEKATNEEYGYVVAVAEATDGGYVILAKGTGGNSKQGIGMYVAIREGAIVSVAIGDSGGETPTYWDKIEASDFLKNYKGKEISMPIPFPADDIKVSGATNSSRGVNSAVNMATWYAREVLGLGENVDAKSQEAIKALEGFANVTLSAITSTYYDATALKVQGANFMMVYSVSGHENASEAYAYKVGNKYVAYVVSNTREVIAKTKDVDTAVDTAIVAVLPTFNPYNAMVDNVMLQVNGTEYVYNLTAKSISSGMPNDYVLKVTVDTDDNGKVVIKDFVVVKNGATVGEIDYTDETLWHDNDAVFDGKDEAGLAGIDINTGATNSNKTVINALQYCLKDYAMSVNVDGYENVKALSRGTIAGLDGYAESKLVGLELNEELVTVEGAEFMSAFTVDGSKEAYVYKVNDAYVAYIVNTANREILAKTDGVATEIETAIISKIQTINPYTSFVKDVKATESGDSIVYELTAISVSSGMPDDYKLKVTVRFVDSKATIVDFVVVSDGSTEGYGQSTVWNGNDAVFDGKDETGLAGININTGATNSNRTVINALNYCLRDFAIQQLSK